MKINFNLKFYKISNLILVSILIIFIIFFIQSKLCLFKCGISNNQAQDTNIIETKVEYTSDKHRLSACAGFPEIEVEKEFTSSSQEVSGYKVMLDCDYAINTYQSDTKDEYFYILDLKNNIKYYINSGEKYLMGSPRILGVQNKNIFIHYCYEGCANIKMLSLEEAYLIDDFTKQIFQYGIDDILNRNKIYLSDVFVLNNRIIIIYENKIYEFNSKDFSLKVLKEIDSNNVFGKYNGGMGDSFNADYKIKNNYIMYNIYNKNEVIKDVQSKSIASGELEIN